MSEWRENLKNVKEKINEVSPTFCLAKWLQVTLHLQHGHTHSCHHPIKHKIPLSELSQDSSALHNTHYKKIMRKKMLQGEAPKECSYCWKMEAADKDNFSDRVVKSADEWAFPHFSQVRNLKWDENVLPRYLEVVFGSECNFKCAYCAPDTSSSLLVEFEKFDAYPTSEPLYRLEDMRRFDRLPLSSKDHNPYIEAFWKWFPKVYPKLKVLRITGGEPLLNSNTFKLLDYIKDHPHEDLEFSVNSNACVDEKIFRRFLDQIKQLKLKRINFYVSVDTFKEQAEYIRFGLNYPTLMNNVQLYLEEVKMPVTFMSAFNILSISRFDELLKEVLSLKKKFGPYQCFIDISWVCHPMYFSPQLADSLLEKKLDDLLHFMKNHGQKVIGEFGFLDYEINKLERIVHLVQAHELTSLEMKRWRKDFALFFQEYDRRKGLSFKKVFPELATFFDSCLID